MFKYNLFLKNSFPIQGTEWTLRAWVLLFLISGALFLDGIDLSMVNIALPSIGNELNLSTTQLQWLVNAYILGYGGFLLLGGRGADLIGRKIIFLGAIGIFSIASIISAFIDDHYILIILRFIKGVSAGFTVPAGMSIVTTSFGKGSARNRALTLYSIFGSLGFASGLVLGGIFTEFGWRATLFAPGPVGIIIFILGIWLIPALKYEKKGLKEFDFIGALTMTSSLLMLVYALVEAPVNGWTSYSTISMLVTSVLLLLIFIITELKHPTPLVRLNILYSYSLIHGSVTAAIILGSFMAYQFIITIYLQESLGWSPISVAMAFLPSSLPVALFATTIGKYFATRGPVTPIFIGMFLSLVGYFLLLNLDSSHSYWLVLFPTMLLVGFGFAFSLPAIYVEVMQDINESEQGLASGILNTSFQIGGAISLAVIVAVLTGSNFQFIPKGMLPNMSLGLKVICGISFLGVVSTIVRMILMRKTTKIDV